MSYRVRKYNKTTEQQIVEAIGKGFWWIISAPFKLIFRKKHKNNHQTYSEPLEQNHVQQKLQEIDMLMSLGHPSNYQKAVLEADKLLDHILKSYRVPGLTMGDRLKSARKKFSSESYEAAWQAHKIRNEIVHNSQYELMDFQARNAIEKYKQVINELIR